MPFTFGQKGFGAAIASTFTPAFLETLDLWVDATEGATALLYEYTLRGARDCRLISEGGR